MPLFDDILAKELTHIAFNVQKNNWDWLHLNSGMERGGKSNFSLAQAKFLSDLGLKFDWSPELKNIVFIEPNISEKLFNIENQSIVVLDEGGEMLLSRQAMKREVVDIVQTLMVYGAKNIFLIINIPDWRWIDKYVRESRVRSLCNVQTYPRYIETPDGVRVTRDRGFYSMYSRRKILDACAREPPQLGRPNFSGRFNDFSADYPDIWANYTAKKMRFLEDKARKKEVEKRKPGRPSKKIVAD